MAGCSFVPSTARPTGATVSLALAAAGTLPRSVRSLASPGPPVANAGAGSSGDPGDSVGGGNFGSSVFVFAASSGGIGMGGVGCAGVGVGVEGIGGVGGIPPSATFSSLRGGTATTSASPVGRAAGRSVPCVVPVSAFATRRSSDATGGRRSCQIANTRSAAARTPPP